MTTRAVLKYLSPLLMASALLAGCANRPVSVASIDYQGLPAAQAILIQRQQAIQNMQARCTLRITDDRGKRQSFDGAVVLEGDQRLRLRAWKFNTALFDVTVNEDGTWLVVSDELDDRAPDAADQLGRLGEQLGPMLRGPDFAEADLRTSGGNIGRSQQITAQWPGVWSEIDAKTLTPTVFHFTGDDAHGLDRIETHYTDYDGVVWLWRIEAFGSFGQIQLDFSDVELNGELNPRAFKPPRRAVKQ